MRAAVVDFSLNNDFSLFSLFLTPSYRMTLEDYEYSAQVEHFNGDRHGHNELFLYRNEPYEDCLKKIPLCFTDSICNTT